MIKKVFGIAAVVLMFAALVPNLNAQLHRDTVLIQNFNSEWSTDSPPDDWDIIHTTLAGATDAVYIDDWGKWGYNRANCAEMYYNYETGIDRLISPVVDCSNPQYTSVWLRLYHEFNYYGYGYTSMIRGSTDGGESFPIIIQDYNEASYGPAIDFIDISSWALGQSNVCIDWYGEGYSWNINWWDVDDVIVYGEWRDSTTGDSLIDLSMVAINRPYADEEGGVAFTPSCKVFNPGAAEVIAPVRCEIKEKGGPLVYTDELSNFPFPSGYTDVSAFKDFTPESNKTYTAFFVVDHPDDIDPGNNDMDMDFVTAAGMMVNPTEILAPTDTQKVAFAPSAKFMEMMGFETQDVTLRCEISDAVYHAVVYTDSVGPETFTANEEKTITFTDAGSLADGNYIIHFWATSGKPSTNMISDPDTTMTFTYSAIVETPVVEPFGLTVTGNKVNFSLAKATNVNIRVYDVAGNVVTSLASGSYNAGSYTVNFDGKPGVYFVKLVTPEYSKASKLVVLF